MVSPEVLVDFQEAREDSLVVQVDFPADRKDLVLAARAAFLAVPADKVFLQSLKNNSNPVFSSFNSFEGNLNKAGFHSPVISFRVKDFVKDSRAEEFQMK